MQLRGMPRKSPPQCAADHAPRADIAGNRCPRRMAHPSLKMKFPLGWHVTCVTNMRDRFAKKSEQLRLDAESLERHRENIVEREAQILQAQKEKLDSFDPKKFNKKRK
jgi:hypothetical protein